MRGSHGRDDAASIPIFAMTANAFVQYSQFLLRKTVI